MDAVLAGLLGTGIGATASILGTIVAGINAGRLEERRAELAREHERIEDVRTSVAEVGRTLFSLLHSVQWVTWHAVYDPAAVDHGMLRGYQEETHDSLPKLSGEMAVVASLYPAVYNKLMRLADDAYALDVMVGSAVVGYDRSPDFELGPLAKIYPETEARHRHWHQLLADIMSSVNNPEPIVRRQENRLLALIRRAIGQSKGHYTAKGTRRPR